MKDKFLEVNSGRYRQMYLEPSTIYATWGEENPYGQLLVMGVDGNVAQDAGQSFDMGLQDAQAYGIAAVGIYGDDDGDNISANWARLVEAQVVLTVTQTGNLTIMGLRGAVVFVAGVDFQASFCSGVEGQIECLGETDVGPMTTNCGVSAGRFIVSIAGNTTVGRHGVLAGVRAEFSASNSKSVTQTASDGTKYNPEGAFAAFAACATTSSADQWDDALYIDGANNALGFRYVDDSYSCGIKAETSTPSGATSHSIRINIAGTAGYIMVYAAEGG